MANSFVLTLGQRVSNEVQPNILLRHQSKTDCDTEIKGSNGKVGHTDLVTATFLYPKPIENTAVSVFYNLINLTTSLLPPNFHGLTVVVETDSTVWAVKINYDCTFIGSNYHIFTFDFVTDEIISLLFLCGFDQDGCGNVLDVLKM